MITIYLRKQQHLILIGKQHQTNFIGNLDVHATMFFIIEESKEIIFDFSQETISVLRISLTLI